MTLKSAVNCLCTMYLNGDRNMIMVGWMEIIKILIISRSSLMTLTRLILVGLLFDLFYQIFDKIYQSVTCNSYNTSIIEPISMDSPPNDMWGFGLLIGWFVGCISCTLQTLYAWLMRGFGIGMVGILIYRVLHLSLRCDSWYTCYVINLVK